MIHKKPSLTRWGFATMVAALMSSSVFVTPSYANPQGGNVVGGSASITEAGKKLDVHQHTDRAVIDWRSFDIDVDEHTQFHQPSSDSIALNRVKSADPSKILGQLSANGNIVLVNPNGVFFGRDAVIDVNGLVATTADIDTEKFMQGGNHYDKPGNPNGAIVNEGRITAKEAGLVGLVAPNVENHGVIEAKMGRVHLASGDTLTADFYGDGLLKVEVTDENVKSQFVGNTGQLKAEGGTVAMTAAAARDTVNSLIVVEGELEAPSVEMRGGKIVIGAAGANKTDKDGASNVAVSAKIDASGRNSGEQGGSIEILGDHIAILDGTVMDASGFSAPIPDRKPENNSGTATLTADKQVRSVEEFMSDTRRAGGSIKVGGDYLGQGDTQTAESLYVGDYVLALNDAIDSGDAGRTIFWSDNTTDFNGVVLARGGVNGGNGGFLETSGKVNLRANGFADLTAKDESYAKGSYLLDPQSITIYGNVDPQFSSTIGDINLGPSLKLWLDGNDIDGDGIVEGINEDGLLSGAANCGSAITCVAEWRDLSGNGNHATQNIITARPTFFANGQNGLDLLNFVNNDGFLVNLDFLAGTSHQSFITAKTTNYTNFYGAVRGSSGSNSLHVGYRNSNSYRINYWSNDYHPNVTSNHNTDFNVLSFNWNQGGRKNIYANGQLEGSGGANAGTIGTMRDGGAIGYNVAGLGYWSGSMNEILMYVETLSENGQDLIEQYQSAKWGIALNKLAGPGSEITEATAHNSGNPSDAASNGYNVFTTRYLERLAGSADLMLQASDSITLDLKGDTLDLTGGSAAGKSITLQTDNGNISDVSSGIIRTTKTGNGSGLNGNISLIAGGTGNILIDSTNLEALNGGQVNLSAGGNVNLSQDSALNLGPISGQNIFIQTNGATSDITLNNTVSASNSGNALTIASGRNFINNATGTTLNATNPSGRWLVYSDTPEANVLGNIEADFKRYNRTYSHNAPSSIAETGNGFLYSIAPTLSINVNDVIRPFGQSNPNFTYSYNGLIDGDTLEEALGYNLNVTSIADRNFSIGNYPLSFDRQLSSILGYVVNSTPGTLTITPQQRLPSTWENVAYANDGLNLIQNTGSSVVGQNYGSGITQTVFANPNNITFTVGSGIQNSNVATVETNSDGDNNSNKTQRKKVRNNALYSGMNVIIDEPLADSLGLTSEQINKM